MICRRSGTSRRMATAVASRSFAGITPAPIGQTGSHNSSVLGRTSSCEPVMQTPCSSGEASLMTADSKVLTALSSAMRANIARLSLSDKLTQSLITSGLIAGITHSSIRRQSGAAIRASALWPLDGGNAE